MKSETIVYPTSLAADQNVALASAVGLACAAGARLITVNAATGDQNGLDERLHQARDLAAKWSRELDHEFVVHRCCEDVTDTLLDAIQSAKPDLVVMGTHGRGPLAQILSESVAEVLARNLTVPTLLVPLGGPGITKSDGALAVRHIVVAAGDDESQRLGLRAASWLASLAKPTQVEIVLVHAGSPDERAMPVEVEGIPVTQRHLPIGVEDAITRVASELDGCLIVMATRGHDGLFDAIGGSHTERVLRRCECPLLAIPIRA